MNKQAVKTLEAAKKILEDNKWSRGTWARKANGQTEVDPIDPAAKCFCSLGACMAATGFSYHSTTNSDARARYNRIEDFMDQAAESLSVTSAVCYNDDVAKSKKDIYKLFDKAIELAKGKS